jgi:hypothetical protein
VRRRDTDAGSSQENSELKWDALQERKVVHVELFRSIEVRYCEPGLEKVGSWKDDLERKKEGLGVVGEVM